jgi:hypothetical protein
MRTSSITPVAMLISVSILFSVLPGLSEDNLSSGLALSAQDQHKSSDLELLEQIVKRTYAVDQLFYRVYTPGWEGANGAIGNAHLFAVTHDSSLLRLYTTTKLSLLKLYNGGWVDDRAWVCLAELYWWNLTGRENKAWVEDAKKRYLDARGEGRLSDRDGFWSWFNWPPNWKIDDRIFTNSNMNEMAHVACWLYAATKEKQFYEDAMLVWNGNSKHPGIEQTFYRGDGKWEGRPGPAAFGKQLPWEGAEYCSLGAAMYRMTGDPKYKKIVVATAKRIMDPANGWVDAQDFYQLTMDGNGAFVHYILDAYLLAPDQLSDVPEKIEKMLEHVWTNHHGTATVVLHRLSDDAIRNGWNPSGGEDGYGVDQVGSVHAQSQAVRAFGVLAYVLREKLTNHW